MTTERDRSYAHQRGLRVSKQHGEDLANLLSTHTEIERLRSEDLILVNCAHVAMLCEERIITREEAARILECLSKLERAGVHQTITVNPRVGDLTTHVEAYIIKETGEETGGKLHTGRSRNDLYPTLSKMLMRRSILDVYEALLSLEESLLSLTSEHTQTIMPGYTHHSQHAQPITLGHYFLGGHDTFGRDLERIEDFWPRLNTCPMGAAALATTGFPLNRARVAELLGFDRIHEHSYDAISSKDFLIENLFILSAIASDLGRIAENVLCWNTFEFGMLTLADEYTSFSSIMPQKKNPVAVETLRALNSIVSGKLYNALGILKAEPWSNGRETTILDDDSAETGKQVRDMVLLLNGILRTMRVNEDRMYELARKGFSTATELADTLVRQCHFPFRTAHEVVGLVVKKAVESGLDSTQITAAMVGDTIREYTGKEIQVDSEWIRKALDPRENVELRILPGGPAAEEVKRMHATRQQGLHRKRRFLSERRGQISIAYRSLRDRVDQITSSGI